MEKIGRYRWTICALVFLATAVFIVVRRIVRPEVRILTSVWDYTLVALTTLPGTSTTRRK